MASGGEDATLQIWDTVTGKQLTLLREKFILTSVTWFQGGEMLLCGSQVGMRRYDALAGTLLFASPVPEKTFFYCAVPSPDAYLIASGEKDHIVRIWETKTGATLFTYCGHSNLVSALAWSPDGQRIASISGGELFVWQGPPV